MREVGRFFKRAYKYANRYGFIRGWKLMFSIYSQKGDEISLKLPDIAYPILLRKNTSDIKVFEYIFLLESFRLNIPNFSPKLIVDGGAYIGLSSIYFANNYPDALVIAIEPENSNFEQMLKNAKFYSNIKPMKRALWKCSSKLTIENPDAQKWAFRISSMEPSSVHEKIESITLPEILEQSKENFIDILKLDIEGAEKDLFQDNWKTWVNSIGVFIVELHDRFQPGCSDAFFTAVKHIQSINFAKGENQFVISKRVLDN